MAKKKIKYSENDEVYWNDPDNGQSSGIYKVIKRYSDEPKDDDDTIYLISNGVSEAEVYRIELS